MRGGGGECCGLVCIRRTFFFSLMQLHSNVKMLICTKIGHNLPSISPNEGISRQIELYLS